MSQRQKRSAIGYYIIFLLGIIIIANNVLQFSQFLIQYQSQTILVMILALTAYILARDAGWKV